MQVSKALEVSKINDSICRLFWALDPHVSVERGVKLQSGLPLVSRCGKKGDEINTSSLKLGCTLSVGLF